MNPWFKYWVVFMFLGASFAVYSQNIFPARQNKLWGYIDTSGTWIVRPMFDLASPIGLNGYARVVADNQVGVVSGTGKVVFKNQFKKVILLNDSIITFTHGKGWGLCHLDGTVLLPDSFDYFYELGAYDAIVIQKGNLHGLCNQKGQIFLPVAFEKIKAQLGNLNAINTTLNGKIGLFDIEGNELIKHDYSDILVADTNFIVVSKNKLIGCLDSNENEVVPFIYKAFDQLNTKVSVWSNTKENFLYNNASREIIHSKAQQYFLFDDERIGLVLDEKYGVLDYKGKEIIEPQYDQITYNSSYFKVQLINGIGLYDFNGKMTVPCSFVYVGYPQDSIIPVLYDGKWGAYFVNQGKIIDTAYDKLSILERQIKATKNKTVAIIDIGPNGKILSKDVYEQVYFFNIRGGALRGFNSDTASIIQIRPNFYFQDNLTKLWGLRNPKGETVIKPIFFSLRHFNGYTVGYLKAGSNRALSTGQIQMGVTNLCGVIDDKNYRMITPPNLLYIDVDDFIDTSKLLVRAIAQSNRFVTFNKLSHRIKQYNAVWMDPINEQGLTRIYVGGALVNSYKEETFTLGTVAQLARKLAMVLPNSKTSSIVLRSNVVCKGGYWNYIDKDGNYLLNQKDWQVNDRFKEALPFYEGTALIMRGSKWGIIDNKGIFSVQPNYDGITRVFGTDLLVLQMNHSSYGYTDQFGNVIGELAYNQVKDFTDGMAWVLKGDQWMLLNEKGATFNNQEMIRFRSYTNGWAPIKTSDKQWALWDGNETTWKLGKLQNLGPLIDGYAKFKQSGKYGYLNQNGIKVMPPSYTLVGDFENGHSWVKNSQGKMAVINSSLKVITPFKYRKINNYDAANQVIVRKIRYGLLDGKGKTILPCQFKTISNLTNGRRIAFKGTTLIILNEKGQVVKKVKRIKKVSIYNEGLCKVLRGRNFGYLDTNGNWALKPVYRNCTDFNDGVALVGPVNSRFIINHNGDTMNKTPFRARHGFSKGVTVAASTAGDWQYYINTLGNNEYGLSYNGIEPFDTSNISLVTYKDRFYGMVHSSGIEIYPTIFPYAAKQKDNKCKVIMNVKSEIVRPNGEVIVPLGYLNITNFQAQRIININGIGASFGYLRYDGSWLYKEF